MADQTCTCPVGECEFEGEPLSVKSHITAKQDEEHADKHGDDYTEEILERAKGAASSAASSAASAAKDALTGGGAGDESGEEADGSSVEDAESAASAGESDAGTPVWMIGAALVALYLWLMGGSSGGGGGSSSGGTDIV